jgi:hypothetical protein
MSLQSPFGPDVQMQLMGLAGYGPQGGSRDPSDMGTREQFMRMMAENRAQSDQQYQRQMQMMQQGQQNQLELMQQGSQMKMKGAAFEQENLAYLNQQAAERHIQMQDEMEQRSMNINAAIKEASGDELLRLQNEKAGLDQKMSQFQMDRAEAEAKAANVGNLTAQEVQSLRTQMQTQRDALKDQRTRGESTGSSFDFSSALTRLTQESRAKATGSQVLGKAQEYIPGFKTSDAHFALQDDRIAQAMAMFGGPEADAITTSMAEGGLLGAAWRGGQGLLDSVMGESQGKFGATGADRLKAAREATNGMSKSTVMMNLIGDDMSQKFGVDRIVLDGLMHDLESYGSSGDPQRDEILKKRITETLTNIGGKTGLGQEGAIRALQAAGKAMSDVKRTVTVDGKEVSKTESRFGPAGSDGTIEDMNNAMGKGISNHFNALVNKLDPANATGQAVFKRGEFQTAEDLDLAYNALLKATGKTDASGKETIVTSRENIERLLADPNMRNALGPIDLSKKQYGRLSADQAATLEKLLGDVDKAEGLNKNIADLLKQEATIKGSPDFIKLMDPEYRALLAQQAGIRRRAEAIKKNPLPKSAGKLEKPKIT